MTTDTEEVTEEERYKTYIVPFDVKKGYPQSIRLTIYKWVFDFVFNYNSISKMPILIVKSTSGKIYSISQLVPYNALYTQDSVTGEPFQTIITSEVSDKKVSVFVAMNRLWGGAMATN